MKTEDILSLVIALKDKTGDIKAIMDDFQKFAEYLVEASKIGKTIIQKVEEIKK